MTYCSVVAVLALVGLTKKRFDHYAFENFIPQITKRGMNVLTKSLAKFNVERISRYP